MIRKLETGITDKNGKMIHIWDLVDTKVGKWSNGLHVVVPNYKDFSCFSLLDLEETRETRSCVPLAQEMTVELEVVGGIYAQPL